MTGLRRQLWVLPNNPRQLTCKRHAGIFMRLVELGASGVSCKGLEKRGVAKIRAGSMHALLRHQPGTAAMRTC